MAGTLVEGVVDGVDDAAVVVVLGEAGGVDVVVGPLASGEEAVSGPCRASTPTKPTVVALKMVMGRFIVLSLDGVGLLVDGPGCDAGALGEVDRASDETLRAADEDVALGDVGDELFDDFE